jgi:tRNA G18 (ribose-2'-O)-methylase SpoU
MAGEVLQEGGTSKARADGAILAVMAPATPLRKLQTAEIARPSPSALSALPRHPVTAILDNVRSAHNVGAMLRTADAARLEALVLCGYTPTPTHAGVHKTALGAEETVPWSQVPDPSEVVRTLRGRGYTIAVLEQTNRPTPLHTFTAAHFPLALVVGNEVTGVSDAVVAHADLALEVPQFGAKHSLNVSVAFGIAVYDLVRHFRRITGMTPATPAGS